VFLYSEVRRINVLQAKTPPSANSTEATQVFLISRASAFLDPRRLAGKGHQRRNTSCRGKPRGTAIGWFGARPYAGSPDFVSDLKYLLQNLPTKSLVLQKHECGSGPAVSITFGFRLVSIREAIFTHDLELNVGELRRRIDFPMRAPALLGFVLEALWLLLLAADLIAKMGQHGTCNLC
jgi:hypothetical protein